MYCDFNDIYNDFDQFYQRCLSSKLTQVKVSLVADSLTPLAAFHSLVKDECVGFILESVEQGERWSRYSFVGRNPLAVVTKRGESVVVSGKDVPELPGGTMVLEYLEFLLNKYHVSDVHEVFDSGLVGYLAYDVVREVEPVLGRGSSDTVDMPDAYLQLVGELAIFDHWRQMVVLVKNVIVPDDLSMNNLQTVFEGAVDSLKAMVADLATPVLPEVRVFRATHDTVEPSDRLVSSSEFVDAVKVAKEQILDGEIFQVVLSQRFGFQLHSSTLELYRALRLLNPSPYMYFLKSEDFSVVGSSPEALVRVEDGTIVTRPIAGTRPRGVSQEADRALGAELLEHPKEIAEHVMLVDLARNDLGKVSSFGSVKVDEFMVLEKFSHVMHLSSEVSGRLRDGLTTIDVLKATIPAGTLSGAPKVRAMQIIDELERLRRGVYGGVFGYLGFNGNLDVAIAIRTAVVLNDGRGWVQAGAGIVADSDPEMEDLECVNKAKAVLAAVALANSGCL